MTNISSGHQQERVVEFASNYAGDGALAVDEVPASRQKSASDSSVEVTPASSNGRGNDGGPGKDGSVGSNVGLKRAKRDRPRRPARNSPTIKPSVVHIPAQLLPLITTERARSGRSNGQILIAAIEEGYEELVKQHKESTTIGGRLFASRTAKPQLPPSQPLSPLNIRMYAHDYDVLDKLVAELGAGSRSRLATLALVHYLDNTS